MLAWSASLHTKIVRLEHQSEVCSGRFKGRRNLLKAATVSEAGLIEECLTISRFVISAPSLAPADFRA